MGGPAPLHCARKLCPSCMPWAKPWLKPVSYPLLKAASAWRDIPPGWRLLAAFTWRAGLAAGLLRLALPFAARGFFGLAPRPFFWRLAFMRLPPGIGLPGPKDRQRMTVIRCVLYPMPEGTAIPPLTPFVETKKRPARENPVASLLPNISRNRLRR